MKRKIQKTGGSTLIMSLPKDWAKKVGLNPGDEVEIQYNSDNSLSIFPLNTLKNKNNKSKNIEINVNPKDSIEKIFRLIVAHYLSGYDTIEIIFKNDKVNNSEILMEYKQQIKEDLRDIIGFEIIDERNNYIRLQNFINYSDILLINSFKRMIRLINSMISDTKKIIASGESVISEDIKNRDKEINRFYYLTLRQLNDSLTNVELSKKLELCPRDCMIYSNIAKSLERIGDHTKKIAKQCSKIEGIDELLQSDILNEYIVVQELFKKTTSALLKKDNLESDEIITKSKKQILNLKQLNKKIINNKNTNENTIHMVIIIESLKRICYYCNDICEGIINLNVKPIN